jgi:hypothetical protein
LASHFCQNHSEKHLRAFVEVVEGSEIYNFPIHCLVYFSSKIESNTCSKWPRIKLLRQNPAASRRHPSRRARTAPYTPYHRPALPHAPSRGSRTPRGPRPEAAHGPSTMGVRVRPGSRGARPPGAARTARAPPGCCPWWVSPPVTRGCRRCGRCLYSGMSRSRMHQAYVRAAGLPWPPPWNSTSPSIPSLANPFGTFPRPPKNYPHRPFSSLTGGLPGQELQRRPPPRAAVHPAGTPFFPNQAPKSSLGESLVTSLPFLRPPVPPVCRISAGTTALHGQGPNCVSLFLSREFYANQGHGCC